MDFIEPESKPDSLQFGLGSLPSGLDAAKMAFELSEPDPADARHQREANPILEFLVVAYSIVLET